MKIFVTSLTEAPLMVADHHPKSVVSFIDADQKAPFFENIPMKDHLIIRMNDIISSNDTNIQKQIQPMREHIMVLLDFFLRHDRRHDMLIHCLMGVSRSTAAAYIFLNLHHLNRQKKIAEYLHRQIPHAMPNLGLIHHADNILGHNGAMIKAINALPSPEKRTMGVGCTLSTDNLF